MPAYYFGLWLKRLRNRKDVKWYIETYNGDKLHSDEIAYAALLALAED